MISIDQIKAKPVSSQQTICDPCQSKANLGFNPDIAGAYETDTHIILVDEDGHCHYAKKGVDGHIGAVGE